MVKNRLKEWRLARGLSLEALAIRAGTTKMQIHRLESGARRLSDHWMVRLAPALGVSTAQLLEASVPVVGFVGAGGSIEFEDQFAQGGGMYGVTPPTELEGDMIGLEVRGGSQWPLFKDGYVVLITRETGNGIEERAINDWAVCRLDDGRTMLKMLRKDGDSFSLHSINAEPIEGVTLEWATPVRAWLTNAR